MPFFCDVSLSNQMGSARFCSTAPHESHAPRWKACLFRAWRVFGRKRLFVMHMPYFLFHIVLFRAFRLFDVFCLCQDWVHFWPKANILSDWHSFHLIFHLALNCFVCAAVKRVIFGIIACVVQVFTAFHVLVDFVCLNLQQKAVCVCVDELKLEVVLPLERIVVKIVHQYFVVVENRHPGIKGLSCFTLSLCMLKPARSLENSVQPANRGLAINVPIFSLLSLRTILMLSRFCTFSIVFPNTELFMSL